MSSVALAERAGLLEVAARVGPDAPTLCEGWTVYDLLAHVFVRERDLVALPGLVVPALHGVTERRERSARERIPFGVLLGILRRGVPLVPFGLPGARDAANLHEFFVHHEDVRRANGLGPRPADVRLERGLWRVMRVAAPALLARARPLRVHLRRPDGVTLDATPLAAGPAVTVSGPVPELVLWTFGRDTAAEVDLDGDDEALASLGRVRRAV